MYHFSLAPSDFLAPGFEQKLALCEETRCGYVELSDIIEGTFKSVARSLRAAVAIDPDFANEIPSTKGVL